MPAKAAIRSSLEQFYDGLNSALQNGEFGLLDSLWSHDAEATLIGSTGEQAVGWDEIRAYYERLRQLKIQGRITTKGDVLVRVYGNLAYAIYQESGEHTRIGETPISLQHRATTIFRMEDGIWRVIHHHADPSAALQLRTAP